jgi:membrane-associated protein
VFRSESQEGFWARALNREHLNRAHDFFERHGGNAIVIGRFAPIIRTFVPFVAGAVSMTYSRFVFYNVSGGLLWVGVCVGAGYAFGNVPIVKNNFSIVALGIVVVSLIPMGIELLREIQTRRAQSRQAAGTD